MAGRLIAFEGVDGAGKSTVLTRVAETLRQRGETVFLPRVGKDHSSRPTRMIRDLTRDRRNLELRPLPELMLYCAREAQIIAELVRPALDRGETVLIDRSLMTPIVLGMARGLSREECEGAAALASGGLQPDLTLCYDVHPRTSRIRKRIARVREHTIGAGGRKGLAGSAFKERVRDTYRALAAEHGHPLLHAERATPDEMTGRTLAVIDGGGAALRETEADRTPHWMVEAGTPFEEALESLPPEVALFLSNGLICARALRQRMAEREPRLALWSMDPEDPLRVRIAEHDPGYALRAINRKPLGKGPDDDLRLRLLDSAPAAAIAALKHLDDRRSDALREQWAEREPSAVVSSLTGREDERAWALRDRCWGDAREESRAGSLGFCDSERAWKKREKLLRKNPILALGSLRGLTGPRVDGVLGHYAALAPKKVLSALGGRSDDAAHGMREALMETGREVVDSVRGLDDDRSFALRERCVERWPSTVAHSLLGLSDDARTAPLVTRCRELAGGDMHVLRRLQGLSERPSWPQWARTRRALLQGDTSED